MTSNAELPIMCVELTAHLLNGNSSTNQNWLQEPSKSCLLNWLQLRTGHPTYPGG